METELNWGNALVTGARKGCRAWNRYIELACGRSSSGSTSCSREPYRARLPRNKNWSFSNESHVLKRVSCFQTSLVLNRVQFQASIVYESYRDDFYRVLLAWFTRNLEWSVFLRGYYFWVWSAMKAVVVKIVLPLLVIALVTSNVVAQSRLHREYKNGKKTRKWYNYTA